MTFNEGDLVEAVKGESVARGRIRDVGVGPFIDIPDLWTVALLDAGYTIRTIEKAAPPLPTEGTWLDRYGQAWQFDASNPEEFPIVVGLDGPEHHAHLNAPFTRLEPVAETVEKVAVWLVSGGRPTAAREVRAQFGATS